MKKVWRLDPGAERDLDEGYAWYESKEEGLGLAFARAVRARIAEAQETPGIATLVVRQGEQLRRVRVPEFPYAFLFVEWDEEIVVLTVKHKRQDDGHWLERLKRSSKG